jgi:hypothetical protein
MPDSTLELAKRCPDCKVPGDLQQVIPGPRRSKVNVYICKNERCKTTNETWIVQINADGTIPERKKGPKEFPNSQRMNDMGKSYVDYLQGEVERGETRGGM